MESLHETMAEYKKQIEKGIIQKAYKGLMDYMMMMRTHLHNRYPDYLSGSIYYGYMDMTYFSFFPESLKQRNLKIAIVFIHNTIRFEAWLAGVNKKVQEEYWRLFKASGWNMYHVVPTTKNADAIVECVLAEQPDFIDLEALTNQIEGKTIRFIKDIESFLTIHNK